MSDEAQMSVSRIELLSDRVNPIVVKEVRQALRGDAFFKSLWGVLMLSALACIVALTFVSSTNQVEQFGVGFFSTVYVCMCIALMALTPIGAFQSLAGEWDDDSFELLVASDLGPGQIIRGKLLSALVQGGLLGVAFLPMLAVALSLPGLDVLAAGSLILMLALGSSAATSLALGIASVARRRPVRILALGLLVALTLALAVSLIQFGAIVIVDPGELFDYDVLAALATLGSAAIFFAGYAVLVAQAQISHPEENKSSALRIWTVLAMVLGVAICGLVHLVGPTRSDVLEIAVPMVLVGVSPALFTFATESKRLPRRVEYELRSGRGGLSADLLMPGGARGLLLAWVLVPMLLLVASIFGVLSGDLGDLSPTFLIAVYLLTYLSLGSLFVRLVGGSRRTGKLRVGFVLMVIASMIIPSVIGSTLGSDSIASGHHVFNPFWVLSEYGGQDLDLFDLAGPLTVFLYMGLGLALLINLPGIFAAIRHRRRLRRQG
ncbi:hypothetical protein [Engelhardtia mirabilis]|uniref:ABC-2 family transporter protein n=1 Tax=Engelhardtia mirabilis TaxID=2528011 RepID=A0A518BIK8_9BACT|nr:hypothetical protein Pla133_18780 [Planctomycetes bacterium Pla133]QDV01128.1 hypothetical protein Pla86_18770 [Planctomycetes bacterium Pla86]